MLDQDTDTLVREETATDDALYCALCGETMTRVFFGLIKTSLTGTPGGGDG